jgi:dTDP-4-dehydrorhamnose reductase
MVIVVFGSNGMLGRYVCSVLSSVYTIHPVTRDTFDICRDPWNKLEQLLCDLSPNIIINCAGCIPQRVPFDDYSSYIRVNSLFPHKLNEYAKRFSVKFIHITTDCIFNGETGSYLPTDSCNVDHLYGISKYLGEPEDATILRTSIIGEEITSKKSLLEWVRSQKNGQIQGYTTYYWNGVTCLTLARILLNMIQTNIWWKGVKHIFSPNVVSKYELCSYINDIYDLKIDIIPVKKECKNLTLSGDCPFHIDSIYEQIKLQKNYQLSG